MQKNVLLITNKNTSSKITNSLVKIINSADCSVIGTDHNMHFVTSSDLKQRIAAAFLIIADVTDESNDFAVGQAFALAKPLLFISSSKNYINTQYSKYLVLIYNENENDTSFYNEFKTVLLLTIENITKNRVKLIETEKIKASQIFISYSHKDKDFLDRLLIHLKPLERNGIIDIWVDTRIKSGDHWEKEIEKALSNAKASILLVSADYMASDFIINNELQPLLETAQKSGTIIIPIIIKPCRFLREPSLNIFQAINDPVNPLCALDEYDKEKVYDLVSQRIEGIFA